MDEAREMLSQLTRGVGIEKDVVRLMMIAMREGKKIRAIKHFREATGSSLIDAKNFVEIYMRPSGTDLNNFLEDCKAVNPDLKVDDEVEQSNLALVEEYAALNIDLGKLNREIKMIQDLGLGASLSAAFDRKARLEHRISWSKLAILKLMKSEV